MDRYLERYVGKYCVKAHYDLDTNDIPRDKDGNIIDSFADFYIACKNGTEIKHVCPEPRKRNHYLMAYIIGNKRVANFLKNICLEYGVNLPNDYRLDNISKYTEKNINDIVEVDVMDGEATVTFIPEALDRIIKYLNPIKSGVNTKPLSNKKKPKPLVTLPNTNKEQIDNLFKKYADNIEPLEKARIKRSTNKKIKETLNKSQIKELKINNLDLLSYIHKIGKWDKYINILENELKSI